VFITYWVKRIDDHVHDDRVRVSGGSRRSARPHPHGVVRAGTALVVLQMISE